MQFNINSQNLTQEQAHTLSQHLYNTIQEMHSKGEYDQILLLIAGSLVNGDIHRNIAVMNVFSIYLIRQKELTIDEILKKFSYDILKQFSNIFFNKAYMHAVLNNGFITQYVSIFRIIRRYPDIIDIPVQFENVVNQYLQIVEQTKGKKSEYTKNVLITSTLYLIQNKKDEAFKMLVKITDGEHYDFADLMNGDIPGMQNTFNSIFISPEECVDLFIEHIRNQNYIEETNIYETKKLSLWINPLLWSTLDVNKKLIDAGNMMLEAFEHALEHNLDEKAFFLHQSIAHILLNLSNDYEKYQEFENKVVYKFSKYCVNSMERWGITPTTQKYNHTKTRIGVLLNRSVWNSVNQVIYSELKKLKQTQPNIELFIYDIESVDRSLNDPKVVDKFRALVYKHYEFHKMLNQFDRQHLYEHFTKAKLIRDTIISDEIDVFIFTNAGAMSDYLVATRSAPVQIYWNHGYYVYNAPNTDERMEHGLNASYAKRKFTIFDNETSQNKEITIEAFLHETEIATEHEFKDEEALFAKIRKDAKLDGYDTIIGVPTRLVKLQSPEYIKMITEVLLENPKTKFLAMGGGNADDVLNLFREAGANMEQVAILAHQPPNAAKLIDIIPSTIEQRQGNTLIEHIQRKKPIVVANGLTFEYNPTKNIYIRYGAESDSEYIVDISTKQQYQQSLNSLIRNKTLRNEIAFLYNGLYFRDSINISKTYENLVEKQKLYIGINESLINMSEDIINMIEEVIAKFTNSSNQHGISVYLVTYGKNIKKAFNKIEKSRLIRVQSAEELYTRTHFILTTTTVHFNRNYTMLYLPLTPNSIINNYSIYNLFSSKYSDDKIPFIEPKSFLEYALKSILEEPYFVDLIKISYSAIQLFKDKKHLIDETFKKKEGKKIKDLNSIGLLSDMLLKHQDILSENLVELVKRKNFTLNIYVQHPMHQQDLEQLISERFTSIKNNIKIYNTKELISFMSNTDFLNMMESFALIWLVTKAITTAYAWYPPKPYIESEKSPKLSENNHVTEYLSKLLSNDNDILGKMCNDTKNYVKYMEEMIDKYVKDDKNLLITPPTVYKDMWDIIEQNIKKI